MYQQTDSAAGVLSSDFSSEIGRLQFVISAALAGLRVAMPVKVLAVSNTGGVSPIGTVDLQPLVSALDGSGVAWPHGTIHNVPYMRIQGGSNAVILDPQVGDIGIATVCDRDISAVKSTGAVAAPGSTRKNDLSDMVYLMTIIGAAPSNYVQFRADGGINVVSTVEVTITAPQNTVNGPLTVNGNVATVGTLTNNGVDVGSPHVHGGVTPGGATTTGPQ